MGGRADVAGRDVRGIRGRRIDRPADGDRDAHDQRAQALGSLAEADSEAVSAARSDWISR